MLKKSFNVINVFLNKNLFKIILISSIIVFYFLQILCLVPIFDNKFSNFKQKHYTELKETILDYKKNKHILYDYMVSRIRYYDKMYHIYISAEDAFYNERRQSVRTIKYKLENNLDIKEEEFENCIKAYFNNNPSDFEQYILNYHYSVYYLLLIQKSYFNSLKKISNQLITNKFDFLTQKDLEYLDFQYKYKTLFYEDYDSSRYYIIRDLENLFYRYSKEFSIQQKFKNYFERKKYKRDYFFKLTPEEAWQKSIKKGVEIKQFKSLIEGDVIFDIEKTERLNYLKDSIYDYSYDGFSQEEKIRFIWAWILGKLELFLVFLATSYGFAFCFTKFYMFILNKYKPFKKLKKILENLFKQIKSFKIKTNTSNLSDKLKEHTKKKKAGLITEEDYNNKKMQLLDRY